MRAPEGDLPVVLICRTASCNLPLRFMRNSPRSAACAIRMATVRLRFPAILEALLRPHSARCSVRTLIGGLGSSSLVGWVEHLRTPSPCFHRRPKMMGFAALYPSYELRFSVN